MFSVDYLKNCHIWIWRSKHQQFRHGYWFSQTHRWSWWQLINLMRFIKTHLYSTMRMSGFCVNKTFRLLGSGSSPVSWCDDHERDNKSVSSCTSRRRVQDAKKINRVHDHPIMTPDEDQNIFLVTSLIQSL